MSFGGSKKPKITQQAPVEEVQLIKEDETKAAQRERRKIVQSGGRQSTIIAGLKQALGLKKQLGE